MRNNDAANGMRLIARLSLSWLNVATLLAQSSLAFHNHNKCSSHNVHLPH